MLASPVVADSTEKGSDAAPLVRSLLDCVYTKGDSGSRQSKDSTWNDGPWFHRGGEHAGNPWNYTVLVEVDMTCYILTSDT